MTGQGYRGFASWSDWSRERRKLEVALEATTPGSAAWRERMEALMKFDSDHPDRKEASSG